jgi:HlyD family secretion protein
VKTTLIILGIVLVVLVGGAIWVGPKLQGMMAEAAAGGTGKPVRMEPARQGVLIETVKAPGDIEPHTNIDISAEVSARIEELPFDEGDVVKKGDILVRLDDQSFRAELASAEARRDGENYRLQSEQARLEGLLSNLEYARRELERQRNLHGTGDVSRKVLEDAEQRFTDLQASVDATKHSISVIESSMAAAKADIDHTKNALDKTTIRSPIDGVITALHAEVGEVVLLGTMNNPGTVILTVADLSRMILNARVSEHDISGLREGQNAVVHLVGYENDDWTGVVTNIALQRTVELGGTGYFKTEIELDMRGRQLRSGVSANVDIETLRHDGIIVPFQAVLERLIDDLPPEVRNNNPNIEARKRVASVVFRVVDGKAVITPVRPGPSDDFNRLVLGGLSEGDIVISGPYKVLDGDGAVKHNDAVMDEAKAADTNATTPDEDAAPQANGQAVVATSP